MQKMWTVLRKDGPDHLGLWTTNASGGSNRREDCRCGRPAGGEQGVPRRPSQLCSSSRSRSCAPGARHAHNVLGAPLTHRLTVVTAVQATIISNVTSATNAARAGGTSPEGQLRLSLSVSLSLSLSLSLCASLRLSPRLSLSLRLSIDTVPPPRVRAALHDHAVGLGRLGRPVRGKPIPQQAPLRSNAPARR